MSYRDFSTHFQRVEICNIQPDSIGSGDVKRWEYTLKDGSWTRNVNAGGCRNNPGEMPIGLKFPAWVQWDVSTIEVITV